ncbi:hypothetical protein DPMN_036840 [Dreissena polymorpha]|uniref:Uncharacterized protein n=1 Tax=Dreissena polymorpha TaxID=45954 RepID=A0A9D4RP74_DREPO|nr:hypothetical protein DPMN_036840 [Dreissena polymorpha]
MGNTNATMFSLQYPVLYQLTIGHSDKVDFFVTHSYSNQAGVNAAHGPWCTRQVIVGHHLVGPIQELHLTVVLVCDEECSRSCLTDTCDTACVCITLNHHIVPITTLHYYDFIMLTAPVCDCAIVLSICSNPVRVKRVCWMVVSGLKASVL